MTSARRTEGWREADTFYDFYHHPPFSLFSFILPFPEPSDWFAPYQLILTCVAFRILQGFFGCTRIRCDISHLFIDALSNAAAHFQSLRGFFVVSTFYPAAAPMGLSHQPIQTRIAFFGFFSFFLYLSQRLTHCFELFNILSVFAEMPTYCPENL